jgi:RHS repeat-associated protein
MPGVGFSAATFFTAEYDGLGRFRNVQNDFVANSFRYDSLNGLLEETTSFADLPGLNPGNQFVVRREFASNGAATRVVYPSGRVVSYTRDVLDRVTAIQQLEKGTGYPGGAIPDALALGAIDYEGLQVKRVSRSDGAQTAFRYDFANRTVEIAHSGESGGILTLQFLYDAVGNMRQKVEVSDDFSGTKHFTYDSLSRLFETSATASATLLDLSPVAAPGFSLPDDLPDLQAQSDQLVSPLGAATDVYNYDLVGNRESTVFGGVVQEYEPTALDQYRRVHTTILQYDPNGNLTQDDAFLYSYDHRNQLSGLTRRADGQQTTFIFDYFGRRSVELVGDGDATLLLYDDHRLIERYEGQQLGLSVVADAQEGVLAFGASGREFSLLSDLSRSARYLLDSGTKLNFYVYDEFGRLRQSLLSADDNPFRFAGKLLLGDSGKYDFVFRAYDPALGRFLQRDPKGYVDGTNLYTFARNNPLVFSDALGMESRPENGPLAAKLGAELAYRHPPGFTLMVPDNFDDPKLQGAKERINNPTDRGVGIRSRPPGQRSATRDIRRRYQNLRDVYNNALPPNQRAVRNVRAIDHTVELQTIIRPREGTLAPGADTVRPQDHRPQDWSLNSSQGRRLQDMIARQIRNGAPIDTPAGGIARERDFNKFWNREGYRTGMRYVGYYNMVGGTWSSLDSFGDDIREGNWGSAALNGTGAAGGMLEIGGLAARSAPLLNAGRFLGAPAAVVSSGVIGVRIGTNLYENYVDKEMVMDAGSWVEEKTGSRVLGAFAASGTAVVDAIASSPEAAYDYALETWTLDPDEIDWDRTFKPWKWF